MSKRHKSHQNRRGYVRHTVRDPADKQHAELAEYGCGEIYEEGRDGETIRAAVDSLRPGDELVVTTLDRIAGAKHTLRPWLDEISARKSIIVETRTGRRSDVSEQAMAMVLDAITRKGNSSEIASAAGKLGIAKRKRETERRAAKARKDWHDDKLTNEQIAAKYDVAVQTLYSYHGKRPKPPGPAKKPKQP